MTGGPGLGKSRLCEFFALSVSNRREDTDRKHFPGGVVRRFSCRPETSTSVRGPIVQFFRNFLGINRSLNLSEAIYKVERYLLSMGRPVLSDLSIFLQFLLGDGQWSKELAHFSPGKINELIESLLLNLTIQRSSESPLLLIIEDLHWADSSTAALIKKILEQHDPIPVFTLVTARSQESGSASYNGSYRSRWKEDEGDESNFEVDEVFDRTLSLSPWLHPEGIPFETESLPFEENELCPEDALENLEDLEESFHEATGNEGASFERSYQSAALVLWPRNRKMSVIHRAGLAISLPFLDKLISEWENAHSGQNSLIEKQAEELSGLIIHSWTPPERINPWSSELKLTPRMLSLLSRLGNESHIGTFIERLMVPPVYGHKDNEALIGTIRLLPSSRFSSLMTNLIGKNAESALEACADLLKRWANSESDQEQKMPLEKSAETLVGVLSGKNPKILKEEKPVFIVNLLEALERIAPHLSIRSSSYILENPEIYGLDESLIPAVLFFLDSKGNEPSPSFEMLRTHCLDRLRERTASLLEPPKDWVRFSKISCKCPDCKILREFLADPDRSAWSFKAAESGREHIRMSIQKDRLDLDSTTEKKSRPLHPGLYEKLGHL